MPETSSNAHHHDMWRHAHLDVTDKLCHPLCLFTKLSAKDVADNPHVAGPHIRATADRLVRSDVTADTGPVALSTGGHALPLAFHQAPSCLLIACAAEGWHTQCV